LELTRRTNNTCLEIIRTTTPPLFVTRQRAVTNTPMFYLNGDKDIIVGLYNTNAGQSTGGFNESHFIENEWPRFAMDSSLLTKYTNFGHNSHSNYIAYQPGIGTGFLVTPLISNATLAFGLLFCTANDYPNRDPITVTLEGSNEATLEQLHKGSSWTLIYDGPTGINLTQIPDRYTRMLEQYFPNTVRYASYRLLITSQRGDETSVQYSEARIIGYI
jgi:hypothetical protein